MIPAGAQSKMMKAKARPRAMVRCASRLPALLCSAALLPFATASCDSPCSISLVVIWMYCFRCVSATGPTHANDATGPEPHDSTSQEGAHAIELPFDQITRSKHLDEANRRRLGMCDGCLGYETIGTCNPGTQCFNAGRGDCWCSCTGCHQHIPHHHTPHGHAPHGHAPHGHSPHTHSPHAHYPPPPSLPPSLPPPSSPPVSPPSVPPLSPLSPPPPQSPPPPPQPPPEAPPPPVVQSVVTIVPGGELIVKAGSTLDIGGDEADSEEP